MNEDASFVEIDRMPLQAMKQILGNNDRQVREELLSMVFGFS